jgi:hypothetical protein
MELPFKQVVPLTMLFVGMVVKAQEVSVKNKSDRPYTVTVLSTDQTSTRTFTLNPGVLKQINLPAGSIRGFSAVDSRRNNPQSTTIDPVGNAGSRIQFFIIYTDNEGIHVTQTVA